MATSKLVFIIVIAIYAYKKYKDNQKWSFKKFLTSYQLSCTIKTLNKKRKLYIMKTLDTFELQPQLDNAQSFYKKAYTLHNNDGSIQLKSYDTIVATFKAGNVTVNDTYSATTLRHIKEFIYQTTGVSGLSKNDIEKDYQAN